MQIAIKWRSIQVHIETSLNSALNRRRAERAFIQEYVIRRNLVPEGCPSEQLIRIVRHDSQSLQLWHQMVRLDAFWATLFMFGVPDSTARFALLVMSHSH